MRFFLFLFLLCVSVAPAIMAEEGAIETKDRIDVYYFYGHFRCSNCYKIETYTKEGLDSFFREEIYSGELVFKPINVDEKENEHFVEDYGLYTKSVVLSRIKDGKEAEYKNLERLWEYLGDKESFLNYIKDEISSFLKNTEKEKI